MYLPLSDASGMPQTVYSAQGGSAIGRAELGGLLDADAVVVGGGFVGCAAALYLAEAGRATVLLENNEVGLGAAGRNAGHVAAHATKLEPDAVLSVYGPIYGPRLNEVGAGAPRMVIDLADRHSMDISIVRGGILTGAHTEAAFAKLQRRARYWRDRGAPVELLDGRATAETIGGGFYFGSVIDRRGIAVNPLALVRGLARAAIAAGARIFERSKVARLRRDGDRWRVETASGTVRCSHVLLCTNAYTDELWPGLRETVIPVRGYQVWTKPLDPAVRSRVLRGVSAMLDTRRLPTGLRLHADGRLQFSGGAGLGREREPDMGRCLARVRAILPDLGKVEVEGWWSGWITRGIADGWRLHSLAPGLASAIGCNGRGVGMGIVVGRELARLALGVAPEELVLPVSTPRRLPGYAFHEPVTRAVIFLHGWRDRCEVTETGRRLARLRGAAAVQ